MTTKIAYENFNSTTQSIYGRPRLTSVSVTDLSYLPTINNVVYTGVGGYITLRGSQFVSGAQVIFKGTTAAPAQIASSVTYISSSEIRATLPPNTPGMKTLYVVNPNGYTCATIINYL